MNDHRSSKQPWLVANDQRMLLRSFSGIYLYVDTRNCRWSSHDGTNKTSLLWLAKCCVSIHHLISRTVLEPAMMTHKRRFVGDCSARRCNVVGLSRSIVQAAYINQSVLLFLPFVWSSCFLTQSCICRLDAEKPHVEATWDPCEQQPTASSFLLFSLDLFLVSLRIISSLAVQEDVIYRVWMID